MSGFSSIAVAIALAASQASDEAAEPVVEEQAEKTAADQDAGQGSDSKPDDALPRPSFNEEDEKDEKSEISAAAKDTLDMIDEALKKINPDTKRTGNAWQMEIGGSMALIITDPRAERMRIMVPITEAEKLDQDTLVRLMQANFDSALDARYGISRGVLWGTYIHPLVPLVETQFLSGLAQAITVAATFGTSYSSGAIVFGGGDSQSIREEELFEKLRELSEQDARNTV